MKNWLKKIWWCKILNWHQWTNCTEQGIEPKLPEELSKEALDQLFLETCIMYCSRCSKESEISIQFRNIYKQKQNTQ